MTKNHKGQAAIEYLMSYGWALLIILAVVGILIASGIWKRPAPSECFVHPDMPCEAAAVVYNSGLDKADLRFMFRNNQGGNITIIDLSGEIVEGPSIISTSWICEAPTTVSQGEEKTCSISYPGTGDIVGENVKVGFTMKYKDEMEIEHTTSGHVRTNVIPG